MMGIEPNHKRRITCYWNGSQMNIEKINELQEQHGLAEWQRMINDGSCWALEGWYGRRAMALLEMGACYLPEEAHRDYYGNQVPARHMLQAGTKGTLELSESFWSDRNNYVGMFEEE